MRLGGEHHQSRLILPPRGSLARECLRSPLIFPKPAIITPSRWPLERPRHAAITLVGTAKNSGTSQNVTITLPTLAENDVVYVAACAAHISNPTWTTPSGYTVLETRGIGGARIEGVWRKVMGASPDSSVTVTNSLASFVSAVAMCVRGVNTTTPEDATTTKTNGTSGTPNPPSITTVTDGAWVIAIGCGGGTAPTAAPTNYNDLISQASPGPNNSTAAAWREIAAAGAEDPGAFTNGTSTNWGAYSVAVRPIAGQPYAKRGARVPGMLGAPGFARPGWN